MIRSSASTSEEPKATILVTRSNKLSRDPVRRALQEALTRSPALPTQEDDDETTDEG